MGVGLIVTVILLGAVIGVVARLALSTENSAVDTPPTAVPTKASYDEESVASHAM